MVAAEVTDVLILISLCMVLRTRGGSHHDKLGGDGDSDGTSAAAAGATLRLTSQFTERRRAVTSSLEVHNVPSCTLQCHAVPSYNLLYPANINIHPSLGR